MRGERGADSLRAAGTAPARSASRPSHRMRRPPHRPLALALALAASLAACSAATVPSVAPRPASPLPLTLGLCLPPESAHAALFGADGELFRRVVPALAAGADRPDLVARAHVVGSEVRRSRFQLGLMWWTLGIVPDVVRLRETARVELRRPAPDGNPCAVPWSGGHAATAPDAVILDGRGAVTGVNGWVSLLVLRPTPWWSEDAVFVDEVPRDRPLPSVNLARAEREAVVREIVRRTPEIRAMAGR